MILHSAQLGRATSDAGGALAERIAWFIRVRWAAFFGQAAVFAFAVFVLRLGLPAAAFVAVEMILAMSNGALYLWRREIVSLFPLGLILLLDIVLLTILLANYGGHANPFSMVYLVHVVLAALLIGHRWTWVVAIFSTLCFTFLFQLPGGADGGMAHVHGTSGNFNLHLQGMLIAFIMLSFLIAGLVSRMRIAIDRREHEILRRRSIEERLAALTQLAAGAAHELGTPLSTASVVVSELLDQIPDMPAERVREDLRCIRGQLDRCAGILRGMSAQAGESLGEMPASCAAVNIGERVRQLLPPHFSERLQITVQEGVETLLMPVESVSQAISSLAKNAFEASPTDAPVKLAIGEQGGNVIFEVCDRGEGMDAETIGKLGEPFFTTKEPGKGTGLGIFLCRLLVARLDGMIDFHSVRGEGTTVSMAIPMRVHWRGAS